MTQGQAVAKRDSMLAMVRSEEFREQLELALPEHVSPRRFARIAMTALVDNPDLARADENSVYGALLKTAADGLMPDGREAALVLFKGKAAYLPMIGGYRKIAAEHGWTLETRIVFVADDFSYTLGDDPRVHHSPASPAEDPGSPTHAYAVARHRSMPTMIEVMTTAEVERIRATSRAKDSGPWVEWWDRMAEKTVGRKLFKRLPLGDSARVASIINADDLEPAAAADVVYGEGTAGARETSPAAEEANRGASAEEPSASEEPSDPATTPPEDGSELFDGEEPELDDSVLDLVMPNDFKRYAGRTIREIVDAGDRNYLVWMVDNVKDERIITAARAGLDALSRS